MEKIVSEQQESLTGREIGPEFKDDATFKKLICGDDLIRYIFPLSPKSFLMCLLDLIVKYFKYAFAT